MPTRYSISKVNDDGKDTSIEVDHTEGEISPGHILKVTVTYTPRIAGISSFTQFKIAAFGGNEIQFNCKGQADGYDVELSSKTVHFGEVQVV